MRSICIAAFIGLLVLVGSDSSASLAQKVDSKPLAIAVSSHRVILTVAGKTTTITADHVTRHAKGYTLRGNFHIIAPARRECHGKDAEIILLEDKPGDASHRMILQLTTRKPLTIIGPLPGTNGKTIWGPRTLDAEGAGIGLNIDLNPKTLYPGGPKVEK